MLQIQGILHYTEVPTYSKTSATIPNWTTYCNRLFLCTNILFVTNSTTTLLIVVADFCNSFTQNPYKIFNC